MADVPAVLDLPTYPVPGEGAPGSLVAMLLTMGLLMTAGAAWLARDVSAPAGLRAAGLALDAPTALQANAPVSAPANGTPTINATAAASQPVAPVMPDLALPTCPGAVSIYFPTGKAMPESADMTSEMTGLMAWARENPNARLAVQGHTDAVGGDESNVLLSFARARTVASALVAGGMVPQQLQVTAAGSEGLISGKPGGARENRRVTVQIHDPDGCKTSTR